jgi:hypothetical protein
MNVYCPEDEKLTGRWFATVAQFVVERLVLGSLAALIVYAGYCMFML